MFYCASFKFSMAYSVSELSEYLSATADKRLTHKNTEEHQSEHTHTLVPSSVFILCSVCDPSGLEPAHLHIALMRLHTL